MRIMRVLIASVTLHVCEQNQNVFVYKYTSCYYSTTVSVFECALATVNYYLLHLITLSYILMLVAVLLKSAFHYL
jgi:hypothetical protein